MLIGGDSVQDGIIFMFGPMRDIAQYIYSLKPKGIVNIKYIAIHVCEGNKGPKTNNLRSIFVHNDILRIVIMRAIVS